MGGNMLGVGNCGQYTGEFNFYGDSESAKIVLDKYAQQVKLISKWFPKNRPRQPIKFQYFSVQ